MNHDDDKRHLWTCGCAAGLAQLLGVWIHTLCALTCLTHWGKNACEFWMVPCTSLVFYVWPLMFTVWLLVNTNRQPVSSRHPIYIGVCAYSSGCQHLSRHEVSHELTRTHTHTQSISQSPSDAVDKWQPQKDHHFCPEESCWPSRNSCNIRISFALVEGHWCQWAMS